MGNCLFDSLNFYLKEKNSHELRRKIVKYIREYPDKFKKDIIHNKHRSVDDYCNKMEQNGRDGDGIALQACILLYNVKVIVYFNGVKNPLVLDSEAKAKQTLNLRYVPGHYSVYRH